jgi:hypothetical protein
MLKCSLPDLQPSKRRASEASPTRISGGQSLIAMKIDVIALAAEWLDLFQTPVKGVPAHNKAFKAKHAAIDARYRELTVEEQDRFSVLIHKKIKEILPWQKPVR